MTWDEALAVEFDILLGGPMKALTQPKYIHWRMKTYFQVYMISDWDSPGLWPGVWEDWLAIPGV